METTQVTVGRILTRTSGYLRTVSSHSLQPYRGCAFGRALCGVGCYVQHNGWVTKGRRWGGFLEVRANAAEAYLAEYSAERRWARSRHGTFSIFMSSATEPFMPQERRHGITRAVLEAMVGAPPDLLIVQTHSHLVTDAIPLLTRLQERCQVRVHLSIETDRGRLAGLPPHASPIERRFEAAAQLRQGGLFVVVTVSPLLPIADPRAFFARIASVADAVVIDHFIEGDGTPDGRRTLRTVLPTACQAIDPLSVGLAYRERMAAIAAEFMPSRVGVNIDGFAGRYR